MKLSSLFPKANSLAAGSTQQKETQKPASLFGNQFGGMAASKSSAPPKGLKEQVKENKASGLFSITWPAMPKQGVKDYQVVTTKEDLIAYLKRCQETGFASFDWETAPTEAARLYHQGKLKDFKIRRLAAKSEYETGLAAAGSDAAKKRIEKDYKATLAAIDKDQDKEVERFGKTPLDPWQGEICTVSITAAPHESRVVFISHKHGSKNYGGHVMTREAARAEVLNLLEEMIFQHEDTLKIAYNLPFETKFAAKYGKYIVGKVADPFVMLVRVLQVAVPSKIRNPKAPYSGKSLKKMTKEYMGVQMSEFKDVVGEGFFDELSTDDPTAVNYSAEDSDYGLQQYLYWDEVAKQIPNAEGCPYANYSEWLHAIEMPFGRVIGIMEYWGMAWNRDEAAAKRREAQAMQEEASDKIQEIAKQLAATGGFRPDQVEALNTINPGKTGKTNDVKYMLYDVLKIPVAKDGKTGPSLDSNAIMDTIFMLERKLIDLDEERFLADELPEGCEEAVEAYKSGAADLPDEFNPERPNNLERGQRVKIRVMLRCKHKYADEAIELLNTIQNIQTYSTLLSSHIEGREKYVNEISGRIHANYTPWTATSRLSSNSPNGQNVPRPDNDVFAIRNLYRAAPGKVMTFIDFSGFELRLMAWRSGCDVMIKAINDGADLHKMTAATLTGKTMDEVTKAERSRAKPGNFGVNYGGTEHSLQDTYKTFGLRHTLEECKAVVDAVLNTYPGIPRYQREVVIQAREDGFVETIYGYKRLLPDINHPSGGRRGSDERRAGNTPIQGAAADFMKLCQNEVYDRTGRDTYAYNNGDETALLVHGHFDMIGQVHDEIIFECDDNKELVEQGMAWVKSVMERAPLPNFPVPIEAEASAGYMWGSKMDLDKWVNE